MAGPVRHPIDVPALERYLSSHVPEVLPPLTVRQFGFGQSNPTYQLTDRTGARFVLRKKPPGKLVSKTAHKVEREHRVISALWRHRRQCGVPVPRPYCLCEDAAVLGTPFYVMEFLDGRVVEDPTVPGASPRERTAMYEDAVRTLARLHSVDLDAVGLRGFGGGGDGRKKKKKKKKKRRDDDDDDDGFLARQVRTWRAICDAQAATRDVDTGEVVGQLPGFDALMAFFQDARFRPAGRETLVHGDYKLDNLVFHKTEPRVIGILDWEMSTIGHPLSDLANFLTPHETAPLSDGRLATAHAGFLPGATPGLPGRDAIAALYRASFLSFSSPPSSSSPSSSTPDADAERKADAELRWAQAFNMFRGAAVCQGIAARVATHQASSAQAKRYADSRHALAEFAWVMVGRARDAASSSSTAAGSSKL